MTNETMPNPYTARFKHFLARSATVARQRIEAESVDSPISDEARERAQNVLSYALKNGETWAATRDLLLTMAPKMEMAGHRDGWIQYLQGGLAQSQHQNDGLTEAALQFQCGYLYRLMSNYAEAHRLLQASAAHYASVGDTQNQARTLNQLAYLAWQQHQAVAAETLAQQALALLDETALERAMSLSALGLAAIEQHHWVEAEAHHRAALQIRIAHGDRRQIAWSQQNLGYALRGQGKYVEAIAYYHEAIATLTELNDLANCANVQINLGIVYSLQGNPLKALKVYAAAESIFREIGDSWSLAKVLINQGIDYITLCNWRRAEDVLVASVDLFEQYADLSEYLNACYELGTCYIEQGAYNKALAIFVSVAEQLPQIEGTHYHQLLIKVIDTQLARARAEAEEMT